MDLARPLRALDAFASDHHERGVDVGRINGRPFINNVSLGVYAEMLGDPGYRGDKVGVAQAKLQAALSDPEPRRALRITPPDEAPLEGVVAVVVSNNPYEFARWDRLGQRHRLDTGTLQVSVLDASTLEELERLLGGTLLGTIEFRPTLRHWTNASRQLSSRVVGSLNGDLAGNFFVDPKTMPGWLESAVVFNPITHLVTAVRGLMSGTVLMGQIGWLLAACAGLLVVFAPITMYLYRNKE